ncbi:hypothetical protein [Psychromicrobium sp. YIM B11713]|uniref:PH-like domain-containing protein n=1 Tax=Psychromicrobium sp. YIM B11713 TaxID=3145233 RepID=UPI00374E2E07
MDKLGPTIFAGVLVLAIFALIWLGWRNRQRRQADTLPLPEVPELSEPALSVQGQYVATTTEGDWLDRIAVHSLGLRTRAILSIHREGILLERSGAPDLFIAKEHYEGVRLESGMAGKFVEKDGLLVLSWRLGEQVLDTGFRTRKAADRSILLTGLQEAPTQEFNSFNSTEKDG